MTRKQFESDDRFATITSTDIGCHGGSGPRDMQIGKVAAWLLDNDNSTSFCAVLDTADMQVATLDDDDCVVWEPLDEFAA